MKKKNSDEIKNISTGWFSRGLKLSAISINTTAKMARNSLQELFVEKKKITEIKKERQKEIISELVNSIGNLKGLVMKIGQMLSYVDFSLPDEIKNILAKLQDNSSYLNPVQINKVFYDDFKKLPTEIFSEWCEKPFASASIGQVHKAKIKNGDLVAVKIQFPGIKKSIESDLKTAKLIDIFSGIIFTGQEKGVVISELKEKLLEECDYELEAGNHVLFRKLFNGDNRVIVPEIYHDYSSKRILTSKFYEGQKITEFIKTATQEEKNYIGEILWDFSFTSIFKYSIFNCDPHPGNYLIQDKKVVFLDFGCVKRFDDNFLFNWKNLIKSILEKDYTKSRENLRTLNITNKTDSFDFDHFIKTLESFYTPWLSDKKFKMDEEYFKSFSDMMLKNNPNMFKINIPRDFLFLNRLQWGLYAILVMLNATSNWRKKILPLLYDENKPYPLPPEENKNL